MSDLSIISMVTNLTIVVGGFLYFLLKAIKIENRKKKNIKHETH